MNDLPGYKEYALDTGYHVCDLYYWAVPGRDEEWKKKHRVGWSEEAWDIEMEKRWMEPGTRRLFSAFRWDFHVRPLPPVAQDAILFRGWDFGYHFPALVVAQPGNEDVELAIRASFRLEDVGREIFIPYALLWCEEWFGKKIQWYDFADPSGAFVSTRSPLTDIAYMGTLGVYAASRKTDEPVGINIIRRLLQGRKQFGIEEWPIFVVDETAEEMIQGFMAGFLEHPKKPDHFWNREPQSHPMIDLCDATRYIVINACEPKTGRVLEFYRRRRQPSSEEQLKRFLRQQKQPEIGDPCQIRTGTY